MWASVSHVFSPSTVAKSSEINQNFADIVAAVNMACPSNEDGHLIAMWSGTAVSVPSGWYLCDGSNGTPDLRDLFILGAGGGHNPGDTGGEAEHLLTATESGVAPHKHKMASINQSSGSAITFNVTTRNNAPGNEDIIQTSEAQDAAEAHNNMPPFYALCLIMKA